MKQKYEYLSVFLFNTDWSACLTTTFADVCRSFDADPQFMDNLLYGTFGMSGDEIIEQYRNGPMSVPDMMM